MRSKEKSKEETGSQTQHYNVGISSPSLAWTNSKSAWKSVDSSTFDSTFLKSFFEKPQKSESDESSYGSGLISTDHPEESNRSRFPLTLIPGSFNSTKFKAEKGNSWVEKGSEILSKIKNINN